MLKTHVAFCLDESGSVARIVVPLVDNYNKLVNQIRESVMSRGQEATMTALTFGHVNFKHRILYNGLQVQTVKDLQTSDLYPSGMTPLFDSVARAIRKLQELDDNDPNTAFIINVVTDGQENASTDPGKYAALKMVQEKTKTGRWTFTFSVPNKDYHMFVSQYSLYIPIGNIQQWDETTAEGTELAFASTAQAYDSFFTSRSLGQTASHSFYSDLSNVNIGQVQQKLADITREVQVIPVNKTAEIHTIVSEATNKPYTKGTAFYQLMKTEKAVQQYKLLAIRDRITGSIYAGKEARQMLGLANAFGTVRLTPGDHGDFDIFIQSTSTNRKIFPNSTVLYWPNAVRYTG